MTAYISGIGAITAQPNNTFEGLQKPTYATERYVRCCDPKWSDYFSPIVARRMSTIIRRAMVTTKVALAEATIDIPGAIITGTGLGCIEDTEKFLTLMIADNETFMKPTYFIHSTHNTISSQVAINIKCHGYNNTYVHRGTSFEQALEDAMLIFDNNKVDSVIVGGHDEMTPAYFGLLDKVNYWKKEPCNSSSLCRSNTGGSLAGEGSISFALTRDKKPSSYAIINNMTTFYNRNIDSNTLSDTIKRFLADEGMIPADIDVYMTGINGNVPENAVYFDMADRLFNNTPLAWYKHLSLEYFTAPAFGMMAAARCLAENKMPASLLINGNSDIPVKTILLHNHFRNKTHSLILLSSCFD